MNFAILIGVSVIGWLLIMIIYSLSKDDETKKEIFHNGIVLLEVATTYIFLTLLCYYFNFAWLCWVLFIITITCSLPSFFFILSAMFSKEMSASFKISALISSAIPVFISLNILFTYILKYEV